MTKYITTVQQMSYDSVGLYVISCRLFVKSDL